MRKGVIDDTMFVLVFKVLRSAPAYRQVGFTFSVLRLAFYVQRFLLAIACLSLSRKEAVLWLADEGRLALFARITRAVGYWLLAIGS